MEKKKSEEVNSGEPESRGRVRVILVNTIRMILLLAFLSSIYSGRTLVFYLSVSALALTYVPTFLERNFNVKVPAKFDVIIFLSIYGILFLGDVRGLYAELWWWDISLNFLAAISLGFVGLSVLYVLHRDERINASPFVVAVFSFCFAVAMGAVWEIFEFSMDWLFGFNMQKSGLTDTMGDMIVNSIGALIVSGAGYFYIKRGRLNVVSGLISKVVERNPRVFKARETPEIHADRIKRLIKNGEDNKLEFKSTLRTNLHTKQIDKRIEHSMLKTIVAYLNSHGGTLLVGVSDKGDLLGMDNDGFVNNDKLGLHFTNLIKNHIGSEYLPFIKYDLVLVDGKMVLKVDCSKSNKHVFLKADDNEEFYVRNGPSSAKLSGHALIDYINHNFKRK